MIHRWTQFHADGATILRTVAATALVNETLGIRTYIPEPQRKTPWKWSQRSADQRRAVTANHRRVGGARCKQLQRRRSEVTERTFAHVCETGGARRCWLHGRIKVAKRYLLQVAARNLGRIMRHLFGKGTPKGLQKETGLARPVYLLVCAVRYVLYRHQIAVAILVTLPNQNQRPSITTNAAI